MTLHDKENLITEGKRKSLNDPPIFVKENFVLNDQEILDSEFLFSDLEKSVQSSTDNGAFIILNDNTVNAYAYNRNGFNVVAMTYGCIYSCLYAANLFMLRDDYFTDIGNENACFSDVTAVKCPATNASDGSISLPVSGDDERRKIGYIIASLALKYIVYHEIGHHVCGHLKKHKNVYGLEGGENCEKIYSELSVNDHKKMELEADSFAVNKLIGEFDVLEDKWSTYFEVPLQHLELAMLFVTAQVIVKESLNEVLLSLQHIENSAYPPAIIRSIFAIVTVLSNDARLLNEYREALTLETEYSDEADEAVEQSLNYSDSELGEMLQQKMVEIFVTSEQIYADIFWGRYDSPMFIGNYLAHDWWMGLD